AVHLLDAILEATEDLLLVRRDDDVVLRDREARLRGKPEAERLDRVEDRRQRVRAVAVRQRQDVPVGVRLRERLVDEVELQLLVRREQLVERAVHGAVEEHATRRREVELLVEPELDRLL